MSISIDIPEELYEQARRIAEAHHIPVNEVFAAAFSEQFSTWKRLQERATRGDRDHFLAILGKVPDVEPAEFDRI